MKKLFILILLLMTVVVVANAQDSTKKVSKPNVVVDKDGNYHATSSVGTNSVKTETGKFYIEKDGTKLPIYLSKNKKMFVIKTSKKSGKSYNKYLTE